jgi:hypothetical protein
MRIDDLALLDDLDDEMRRGRIYECSLKDPRWHLDGLRQGEDIFIDPRASVVETLLHELLHRRKPKWGERTVDRTARRLLAGMTEEQKASWWKAYRRIKRTRGVVYVED